VLAGKQPSRRRPADGAQWAEEEPANQVAPVVAHSAIAQASAGLELTIRTTAASSRDLDTIGSFMIATHTRLAQEPIRRKAGSNLVPLAEGRLEIPAPPCGTASPVAALLFQFGAANGVEPDGKRRSPRCAWHNDVAATASTHIAPVESRTVVHRGFRLAARHFRGSCLG